MKARWFGANLEIHGLTLLHQLGPIFAIFGASDRDKSLDLKV
jgi:hypothetical protein